MRVSDTDLAAFPGAPFAQVHIDAVVTKLERALGWHVMPVQAETLKVRTQGGAELILPSRQVVSVSEVRRDGAVLSSSAWSLRSASDAILDGYWSAGVYEVDVIHGHEAVPADLLGEVAVACVEFRTDPTLAAWSSGPFSASLRGGSARARPSATFWAYAANVGV